MKYQFDPNYTRECFRKPVEVPSPVGYKLKSVAQNSDFRNCFSYDAIGHPFLFFFLLALLFNKLD